MLIDRTIGFASDAGDPPGIDGSLAKAELVSVAISSPTLSAGVKCTLSLRTAGRARSKCLSAAPTRDAEDGAGTALPSLPPRVGCSYCPPQGTDCGVELGGLVALIGVVRRGANSPRYGSSDRRCLSERSSRYIAMVSSNVGCKVRAASADRHLGGVRALELHRMTLVDGVPQGQHMALSVGGRQ